MEDSLRRRDVEIERENIPEVETETPHPGRDETYLTNVTYAPEENEHFKEYRPADDI